MECRESTDLRFEKQISEPGSSKGIVAGYNATEIGKPLRLSRDLFKKTKLQIEEKAVEYLR
jgi:hypothetical protein